MASEAKFQALPAKPDLQALQASSQCLPASCTCNLVVVDAAAIVCGPKVVINDTPIIA